MSEPKMKSRKELCMTSDAVLLSYIQIPFCKSLCSFCCWCREYKASQMLAWDKLKKPYLEALKREISSRSMSAEEKAKTGLRVVHFGGGSPSLLNIEETSDILSHLLKCYEQKADKIITIGIEVKPDDMTREKITDLKAIGFNRISIGAQTFDQNILDRLNRRDTVSKFYQTYEWSRCAGFDDINIDLLYGIPFQSFDIVKSDIAAAVSLSPDHIDVHPWRHVPGGMSETAKQNYKEEKTRKIEATRYIRDYLQTNGYHNYNHRCFAREDRENLMHLIEATYMLPFLGFGAGCEQFFHPRTTTDIQKYIDDEFTSGIYTKMPKAPDGFNIIIFADCLIMQLLLSEGVNISYFNRKYNCDIEEVLSFYKRAENLEKERKKLTASLTNNYGISRIQMLRKIIGWLEDGTIVKSQGHLRLREEDKVSYETWSLYMQAC